MIAHIDADAFFASVLQRKHPHLRGKPLLALGMGGGFVIAASYEAKAKGVKTGMSLKEALALAPNAVRIPSDFRETGLASQQLETILGNVCPDIEQFSIDEWFLDLRTIAGGCPTDLAAWAHTLRQNILRSTALSVSIGIGPSKLLAKMASEFRKPGGITVVASTTYTQLLSTQRATFRALAREKGLSKCSHHIPPLPHTGEGLGVEAVQQTVLSIPLFLKQRPAPAIPGIGHRREEHTKAQGWMTAWDIATAPTHLLIKLFGRPGADMQRELNGEIVSPVQSESGPPKSVSRCRSFRSTADRDFLWAQLLHHAEYIVLKMRKKNLAAKGVSVWLRDKEYRHFTFHCSLPQPLHTEEHLTPYIRRCFQEAWKSQTSFGQVGLALWNLQPSDVTQVSLFQDPTNLQRTEQVQQSLDTIRKRFGRDSISRGASMPANHKEKPGLDVSIYT